MKKVLCIAILISFIVPFTLISSTDEVKLLTNAHCGGCKAKIEKALKKVDGVENAELDLETKIVVVKYSNQKTDPETLVSAIKKAGYDAAIYTEGAEIKLEEHKDKHCKSKKEKPCKDKNDDCKKKESTPKN
ncbi:MAG: heavy-metal-associated domain-containing protein [Ignavibacteria bacterium]|nr:heavy-metal-associated domain-containing protein [Ignavibacteria bacterium]